MVTCMMIMSVSSGILLLHHTYSSTSNLGHVYGLLYYSWTLTRLHNHPLYGHVYDDYVMKKHVLCNFCACTLDLFFWKPMELITPLRSIKGHRTLFILTCASVEIGRGCDCHTVDIQVTYYREKKLKRAQSLYLFLFCKPMQLNPPLRNIKGHHTLLRISGDRQPLEIGRGCDHHTVNRQLTYYREKKLKRTQSLDSYLSCLGTPSIPTLSRLSENGRLWMGGSSIGTISMAKWLNQNMKVLSRLWKGPIRRLGGWVKKLIVHLRISVTKWVWMAFLSLADRKREAHQI